MNFTGKIDNSQFREYIFHHSAGFAVKALRVESCQQRQELYHVKCQLFYWDIYD